MKTKQAATGWMEGFSSNQQAQALREDKADPRGIPVDRHNGKRWVSVWSVTGEPVVEMFVGGVKINQGGAR